MTKIAREVTIGEDEVKKRRWMDENCERTYIGHESRKNLYI